MPFWENEPCKTLHLQAQHHFAEAAAKDAMEQLMAIDVEGKGGGGESKDEGQKTQAQRLGG